MSFAPDDPLWATLAAIEAEPSGQFRDLVVTSRLDPATDFRGADLSGWPLAGADLSGFDFTNADLRGTGLRHAARWDGLVLAEADLDPADRVWWKSLGGRSDPPSQPPPGFSLGAAHEMILAGQAPPADWRRWITSLNFLLEDLSDLKPLAGLSGLTNLTVWGASVSDLTPLSGLSGLVSLDANYTSVSDLTPLAVLTGLTNLSVRCTSVSDLTPLSGLSGLTRLDVSGTSVSDLTPLSNTGRLIIFVSDNDALKYKLPPNKSGQMMKLIPLS